MAETGRSAPGDLAAHVLLHGARSVLAIPGAGTAWPGMDAPVGWDGSAQACRALDGAMPLLRAAGQVTVMSLGEGDEGQERGAADRCVAFLRWHGVVATFLQQPGAGRTGEVLLNAALAAGPGLLVIGAYGHAHLREQILGGVTATVLKDMWLPVLLAH